ncbi:unnamed protein product, partial [Rotaria magnacalcarata]
FELQQEDFPPLPHRSNSHEPSSSSTNIQPLYQSQFSSSSSSSNLHQPISNGYSSSQQQQHSQSQSPISFKSTIDPLSTLMSRRPTSVNNKTASLTNNSSSSSTATSTNSQQLSNTSTTNTNGLPSSTITDQYGLVGLLQMIQQAEKSPETSTLLNCDLTTLGL